VTNRAKWLVLVSLYLLSVAFSTFIQLDRFDQAYGLFEPASPIQVEVQIVSEPRLQTQRFASDTEQTRTWVEGILKTLKTTQGRSYKLSIPVTVMFNSNLDVPPTGSLIEISSTAFRQSWTKRSCCILEAASEFELIQDAPRYLAFANKFKDNLFRSMSYAPSHGAALVPGLLLGDTRHQSTQLDLAMRTSGLSHLTAVSGGNVTIVLGFVVGILATFGLQGFRLILGASLTLIWYVLIVGFEPSVIRAATMGSITLAAFTFGKPTTTGRILVFAVFGLTIANPWLLLSWGFGLSVFATAGLVWLAPRLIAVMHAMHPWSIVAALLAATISASVVTAPLIALMTGTSSTVTVIANLLAAPLVAITTVLGLVSSLIAFGSPVIAAPISFLASLPAELIAQIALFSSNLPGASQQIPLGAVGIGFFWVVTLVTLTLIVKSNLSAKISIAIFSSIGLIIPILSFSYRYIDGWPPPKTVLIACDVGQGSALLVPLSNKRGILFDVGPNPKKIDDCLDQAGINTLVAIFLSHFHADHVLGIAGAIDGRRVEHVFSTEVFEPQDQYVEVNQVLEVAGLRLKTIKAGSIFKIDQVHIETIWPTRILTDGVVANLASLVQIVQVAGSRILITGDIEPAAQEAIRAENKKQDFDVALIPHHGSKFQDPAFAGWVGSDLAVVSVGENTFGHPAEQTIKSWKNFSEIFRTDQLGSFAVHQQNGQLKVSYR